MNEAIGKVSRATAPFLSRIDDVDELNCAISGSKLEIVQLRPGPLDIRFSQRTVGNCSVDQGSINRPLHARGALDPLRYSIGLFRSGSAAIHNGHHVDAGQIIFFMPGRELDGHFPPPHDWTTLVVPPEWIESLSQTFGRERSLRPVTDCAVTRPAPRGLRSLQSAADTISGFGMASFGDDAWSISQLRNALGETLSTLDAPVGREAGHTLAQFSIARRAERKMRERLQEPLCIDDLCVQLGVSRRYLEYAFRDTVGASPAQYLRLLRLREVRLCLKAASAETTVTSVALSFGFNHLGLFATQYKKAYGESPSATLAASAVERSPEKKNRLRRASRQPKRRQFRA
jgi:AraC-like DNA-binding protein